MSTCEQEPAERLILDDRFLVDLLFKQDLSGLRLPPDLTCMLLAQVETALKAAENISGDGDTSCT